MAKKEFIEPEWSEGYVQLLDALVEYMGTIAIREDTSINERDITIIRALIEFYDFEIESWDDVLDILSDVAARAEDLEIDENTESRH